MKNIKAVMSRIPFDLYGKLKREADKNLRSVGMEVAVILRQHFYTQKRSAKNGR